jgi:hypothetical protein
MSEEVSKELTWRDLALQFDAHRIEALAMLRYVSEAGSGGEAADRAHQARAFLAKPPLPGEAVLAERIAAIALRSPTEAREAVQCCMCGKTGLSTTEGDGGTECQLSDGRWTCSQDCYDRAVTPAREAVDDAMVDAAKQARDFLNFVILAGTAVIEGHDGRASAEYSPLAIEAKRVQSLLLAALQVKRP